MDYIKQKSAMIRQIPEEKSQRLEFWQFRLQDIEIMTFCYFLLFTIEFALNIYIFSSKPSLSAFVHLLPLIFIFLVLLIIWVLRKRLRNWLPLLYTLIMMLQLGYIVLGTPMSIAVKSPEMQEQNSDSAL